MAAEENIDVEESIEGSKEQEQPSLLEIKALLVDIQIQIASILSENRMLKKEIEELKESANFYGKELKDLKESLQKTKDENKELNCFVQLFLGTEGHSRSLHFTSPKVTSIILINFLSFKQGCRLNAIILLRTLNHFKRHF